VNSPEIFRFAVIFVVISALAYFIRRTRKNKRDRATEESGVDFRPSIGFTRLDGWASLAILLANESESSVFVEEIEIVLAELIAEDQTSDATCQNIQKIRQTVPPKDMLPFSLVQGIYEAAGRPQRKYSCVMSSSIRYRVGEEWFERAMEPYRLKMAGLTVAHNHREPWTKSKFKRQEKAVHPRMAGAKSR
jgi:hypothetical protein